MTELFRWLPKSRTLSKLATLLVLFATPLQAEPARVAETAPVDVRSAALLISNQQGGAIPMAVAAFRRLADAPETGIAIDMVVELDGESLLEALDFSPESTESPDPKTTPPQVEIHIYALNQRLEVVDASSLAIPLSVEDRGLLSEAGLRARITLHLPTGAHRLSVLARAGDLFSLRQQAVQVPAPEAPVILEPRLLESANLDPTRARWLEVSPRPPGSAPEALPPGSSPQPESPTQPTSSLQTSPSSLRSPARAVLTTGSPAQLKLTFLGSAPTDLTLRLEPARLRPGADATPRTWSVGDESPTASYPEHFSFEVPDLPSGLYQLTLNAPEHASSLPLEIAIIAASDNAEPGTLAALSWPALSRLVVTPEASEPAPLELPERTRRRLRRLRAEYLSTLSVAARNGLDAGTAALEKFEASAAAALGRKASIVLMEVEIETLKALARRGKKNGELLPAILLHQQLPGRHRAAGRPRLARHAVDTALSASRFYASSNPKAAPEAAASLALFAADLQRRGDLRTADRVFQEALDLSPAEAIALLGLGINAAWLGQLESADEFLTRYLELHPQDDEIHLRRAVVRQRLARRADTLNRSSSQSIEQPFERHFERLADSAVPWVACLAGQQWIRSAMEREDWQAARQRLLAARPRCPQEPALAFADAWIQARLGVPGAADKLLTTGERTPSTRTRFNQWPQEFFNRRRAGLEEKAGSRLEQLAALVTQAEQRQKEEQ